MAELILPQNRHLYLAELDEMHERRYELFFDGMGWCPEECGVTKGYDKDAFDKHDTVYIIERMTGTRDIVGFCRVNPTTGPHMLRDAFPDYCEYCDIPTGRDIYEVSRVGYDYRLLGRDRAAWKEIRARIMTALTEYCLQRQIREVTYCVYKDIFLAIQRDTWGAVPLGNYQHDERLDQSYIAGLSKINQNGLARCRAMLQDTEDEVLTYSGPLSALQLPLAA